MIFLVSSNGNSPNSHFAPISLFSLAPSFPQTVKGFCGRKHTPAVNHKVGLWSGIVRGLVSNINEVAGTANICQRDSNLFQLLETHRHFPASGDGTQAVSAPGAQPGEHTRSGIGLSVLGHTWAVTEGESNSYPPRGSRKSAPLPRSIWHLIPGTEPSQKEGEKDIFTISGGSESQKPRNPSFLLQLIPSISTQLELIKMGSLKKVCMYLFIYFGGVGGMGIRDGDPESQADSTLS